MNEISVNDVAPGDRVIYPVTNDRGEVNLEPCTVKAVVNFPSTRVLYFEEGGCGVADRHRYLARAAD